MLSLAQTNHFICHKPFTGKKINYLFEDTSNRYGHLINTNRNLFFKQPHNIGIRTFSIKFFLLNFHICFIIPI